ncbi:MAG: DNA-directed RNA polymerase subunit alpha C-terminal domain-containing protein, partial [Ginsengibacter sp.]
NISKNQNMQKEKCINTLLFETALFDFTHLSNEENFILRRYLQDKKTPEQIARKTKLPVVEVQKIIRTGMKKVLLKAKEVVDTKIWFREKRSEKEFLKNELAILKEKFKNELTDKELTARYEKLKVPVANLPFSTRARTVFRGLHIETLNDLEHTTLDDLRKVRNAGRVSINEIVTKALGYGIVIS